MESFKRMNRTVLIVVGAITVATWLFSAAVLCAAWNLGLDFDSSDKRSFWDATSDFVTFSNTSGADYFAFLVLGAAITTFIGIICYGGYRLLRAVITFIISHTSRREAMEVST